MELDWQIRVYVAAACCNDLCEASIELIGYFPQNLASDTFTAASG